jgi:hypothetical protein
MAVAGFRSALARFPACPQLLDPLSWNILCMYGHKFDKIMDLGRACTAQFDKEGWNRRCRAGMSLTIRDHQSRDSLYRNG